MVKPLRPWKSFEEMMADKQRDDEQAKHNGTKEEEELNALWEWMQNLSIYMGSLSMEKLSMEKIVLSFLKHRGNILKTFMYASVGLLAASGCSEYIEHMNSMPPSTSSSAYRCETRHKRWVHEIDTPMRPHAWDGMNDCNKAGDVERAKYFSDYVEKTRPSNKAKPK